MPGLNERVTRHDREIAAIRKLIMQGMRMLVRHEEKNQGDHEAIRKEIRDLAASQRKTDAQLQSLIRSLERGRNGHK